MNIAGSKDIDYIIDKLRSLEEELGGRKKQDSNPTANRDEFDTAKLCILENIHKAKSRLADLNKLRTINARQVDISKAKVDVRDTIRTLSIQLDTLDRSVKQLVKRNDMTAIDKDKRVAIASKLRDVFETLEAEYEGKEIVKTQNVDRDAQYKDDQQYVFQDLMDKKDFGSKRTYDNRNLGKGPVDVELAAMDRWKQQNEHLDDKLKDVNILLEEIERQALEQRDQIKINNELGKKVDKEVSKANQMLDTENARLKELVKKYRSPSKFCLDITLIIFILGLVGVLVMMVKG